MKRFILSILVVFVSSAQAWFWQGETANEYKDNFKSQSIKLYQDTKTKAVKLKNNVVQQANDVEGSVTNFTNEKMDNVTNSLKLWIYTSFEPIFPWMFLILFFVMFGSLKMVIPFSNYRVVQIPIFLGSYSFIFSIFYKLEIASYAFEATLWFLLPMMLVAIALFFSRKTLIPKIKEFNKKFNLEEQSNNDAKIATI